MLIFDVKVLTNEAKAREYLEQIRWPNGPVCSHCGETQRIYRLAGKSHRHGLFHCNACRSGFTVTTGSIMEKTRVPLNKWVLAFRLMVASKSKISIQDLTGALRVSYKTAWFMAHRIRRILEKTSPTKMRDSKKFATSS